MFDDCTDRMLSDTSTVSHSTPQWHLIHLLITGAADAMQDTSRPRKGHWVSVGVKLMQSFALSDLPNETQPPGKNVKITFLQAKLTNVEQY